MRKIVWLAAIAAFGSFAELVHAQAISALPAPAVTSDGTSFSLPVTTVTVDLAVQQETIRSGPYARYAQKYLGVMAPLADKDIYTVADAVLDYSDGTTSCAPTAVHAPLAGAPGQFGQAVPAGDFNAVRFDDRGIDPVVSQRVIVSHAVSDTSFVRVAPDRTETVEKSPEEMARDAANTIFSLRKKRLELITGDAGEYVFGAGMQAALDEIARLENEYLALFLGKHYIRQQVRRFTVIPVAGKTNYIVCRFSDNAGLLPETDLTGRPILLELRPEGRVKADDAPQKSTKSSRPGVPMNVADIVNCRVLDGKTELVSRPIPVYQFGVTIDLPTAAK